MITLSVYTLRDEALESLLAHPDAAVRIACREEWGRRQANPGPRAATAAELEALDKRVAK